MEFTQRTKKASEIHNGIDRMAEKHRTQKVTWEVRPSRACSGWAALRWAKAEVYQKAALLSRDGQCHPQNKHRLPNHLFWWQVLVTTTYLE